MEQNLYALIMAGGGGTRLWPLSRRDHPKQALQLFFYYLYRLRSKIHHNQWASLRQTKHDHAGVQYV